MTIESKDSRSKTTKTCYNIFLGIVKDIKENID